MLSVAIVIALYSLSLICTLCSLCHSALILSHSLSPHSLCRARCHTRFLCAIRCHCTLCVSITVATLSLFRTRCRYVALSVCHSLSLRCVCAALAVATSLCLCRTHCRYALSVCAALAVTTRSLFVALTSTVPPSHSHAVEEQKKDPAKAALMQGIDLDVFRQDVSSFVLCLVVLPS